MDKKPDRLTTAFIKSIDRPTRQGDGLGGNGLSILAYYNADGGLNLAWSQRILIDTKLRTFGLGRWPQITITVARKRAFEHIRKRDLGEDIRKTKQTVPTLGEAFDSHMADHSAEWKRRGERRHKRITGRWKHSKQYCKPLLSKKITDVTHDDILHLMRDDWQKHHANADDIQNHLSQLFNKFLQMEIRASNPASKRFLTSALGAPPKSAHHPSAPYKELGGYLAIIRDSDFWWSEKYCLILLALTEDRSGELREAVWDDVNWEEATLTIPAERMKSGVAHIIPVPRQGMEILRLAESKPRHSKGTIFPPQRGGAVMSSGRLSRIPKKLGLPFVPHGLRQSFGNWAKEHQNPEYRLLAKISLAHKVEGKADEPYFTTPVINKRRTMLQDYEDFLAETCGSYIAQKNLVADDADMHDIAGLEQALGKLFPKNKTA